MSCMCVCMLFTGMVHACDPMSVYVYTCVHAITVSVSCVYIYFTIFISFKPESEIRQSAALHAFPTNKNPA